MITYEKLFKLLEQKEISQYQLRMDNVLSQSTLSELRKNGNIKISTVNTLCNYLKCTPQDILTYIPDK